MRILKWTASLILLSLVCQTALATDPPCVINQAGTSPFGYTRYCVPAISGATYYWSTTGTLSIQSGQGTNCVWVSGSGTLFVNRDYNNTHCYTSIYIPPPPPCSEDPLTVYISGDFALDVLETGTFYANPEGGDGNYSYRWYRSDTNGGQSVVGLSSSYSAQYESPGQYWVKVEVRDTCGGLDDSTKYIQVGCGQGCEQ